MKDLKQRSKNWWNQNLANIVTVIGLISSALFLIAVIIEPKNLFKITLFAFIAGISDFVDGPIARHLKTESVVGSYLDRIRDRIFVYPAIIVLGWYYRNEIIFPEFLFALLLALTFYEVLIFRIGTIGFWWYLRGKDIDLKVNDSGKKKIFAGFSVVFVWIISLNLIALGLPALKFSTWLIYLGLFLMIYWSHVSWQDYAHREIEARKANNDKAR